MNERYDDEPTPADAAEQAEVSRLLAAFSGPPEATTMPADVAARLDDVLAELAAERSGPASAVPAAEVVGVTDLASRRRRRWPALLVAAAAVSVVGLGVGNVLGSGGGADMEAASTADDSAAGGMAAEQLESADGGSADRPDRELSTDKGLLKDAEQAPRPADGSVTALAALPRLRSRSLAVDVQRVADLALDTGSGSAERDRAALRGCARPGLRQGDEWLSVLFDQERAVLVLRAPEDGRRTAEVFPCDGGDTPAAETTVEAR